MNPSLIMVDGPRAGSRFPLDPAQENRIGRGLECDIVLTDALCSRVHAIAWQRDAQWWVRDADSRNGTFVNGQKIDEARLVDGCSLKLGSSQFTFRENEEASRDSEDINVTQTLVFDAPVNPHDTGAFGLAALRDVERAQDLLVLYQLSIKLLGCENPDDVVRTSIELLHERVRASVVGFLWVSDEGRLKPKQVIPEDARRKVKLSETLTDLVCRKGHAVRIDSQSAGDTASLSHFADAICVPLIRDKHTIAAIHIYLERGRFRPSDFEFAVSVANIMAVALVRARQQASLQAEHRRLIAKSADFDELLGESKPMLDLKAKIARVARASGCVLLRGESGSGKELVARALHKASARADRPMLCVNCAAIPHELMESQLFGHRKGAFTSADSDHIGWFQQADLGTLFLDEIGELTLEGQAKLLRILEGHPFLPVGGSKEISVDVRVIAATNRDLAEFVRGKQFREDLYYRLSVFELEIPPLRERGTDIGMLIDFFVEHFSAQHGRVGMTMSEAARQKLLAYDWPGNVRQLRNVIDSAIVMADGNTIQAENLGLRDAGRGPAELDTLRVDDWERKLIREALSRTGGNVPEAAKLLGLGRATLYRKLEEYGISR